MAATLEPKKSAVFAAQLRERIQRGELAPGDRLPSYSELRRDFGLASATAERIYKLLESEGFAVRRQGAGTFVAQPGEVNGARAKTGYIGFVAVGVEETPRAPVWSHLLQGVQSAVSKQEKRVVLLSHDSALGWDDVAGVLLAEVQAHIALQHRPAHLPCVALQYPLPGIATVMADELVAGQIATRHLLELGHQRIGILYLGSGAPNDEVTAQRLLGYRAALGEAGHTPQDEWQRHFRNPSGETVPVGTHVHLAGGYRAMQSWLQNGWEQSGCTALVAQNDQVAIGAMRALREAGVSVPQEVSVIGFDGTETGGSCVPRLSSVRIPVEQIAARGVEVLARQIETNDLTAERILLPPQLVARDSTAPPQ